MKKFLVVLAFLGTIVSGWADDLDALQGKWTVKKSGDRGAYIQHIEFKKNKLIFKIVADDATVFVATGDIELKKQGDFATVRLFNIKAGRSETDLEAVDEERNSVYILSDGQLYIASNFDRVRGNEKPAVDAYTKSN